MRMNPKVQKGAFILLIILLAIFVPLAGVSMFFRFTGPTESSSKENVNKEFYFDNKLWFYQNDGTLLGTYECKTTNCGYAINTLTDEEYGIHSPSTSKDTPISLINERYAILTDSTTSTEAFVYDIVNGTSYQQAAYLSAKDYGIGISDNLLIVENANHQYGVIRLSNMIEPVLTLEYNFIGLKDQKDEEGKVLADYFIVSNDNGWRLMDQNGAVLTSTLKDAIVDYTGTYLITRNENNYYHVVDYNNNSILPDDFANLSFTDKYLNCFTISGEFYVYDIANQEIVSSTYKIDENDDVLTTVDPNNNVVISINNSVVETIES